MRAGLAGRRRDRGNKGAAAVEFALIVPILLLIVVGILNFGVVLAQQISLNNAARQAARYAVVDGPTCGDIQTQGREAGVTLGMGTPTEVPLPNITVESPATGCPNTAAKPCASSSPGNKVTVTMTRVGGDWLVTMPPFNLIPFPNVSGKGVMRCEFS